MSECTARTDENVDTVNHLILNQKFVPKMHQTTYQIAPDYYSPPVSVQHYSSGSYIKMSEEAVCTDALWQTVYISQTCCLYYDAE